jgi:hypothetical protein
MKTSKLQLFCFVLGFFFFLFFPITRTLCIWKPRNYREEKCGFIYIFICNPRL